MVTRGNFTHYISIAKFSLEYTNIGKLVENWEQAVVKKDEKGHALPADKGEIHHFWPPQAGIDFVAV